MAHLVLSETTINKLTQARAIFGTLPVKLKICNTISQNRGSTLGLIRVATIRTSKKYQKMIKNVEVNCMHFSYKKKKCLSGLATFSAAWVRLLMVVSDAAKFERKNAFLLSQNRQFNFFYKIYTIAPSFL